MEIDSVGRVSNVAGLRFLSPEEAVFSRMLSGWRNQQIDTLPYWIVAALLLLYAQPIVKITQLRTTDIVVTPYQLLIKLETTDPSPFQSPSRTSSENTY